MAAQNRRDISLIIRAKDEAGKAFESATAALIDLLDVNTKVGASAKGTGADLKELAGLALSLDRSYAKIAGAADKASDAFDRQQDGIRRQEDQLAALKAQAESAAQAMRALEVAIVDRGINGDTAGQKALVANLKAAGIEANRLQEQIAKVTAAADINRAALEGQRSTLQQVGSTAIAAAEAQEKLAALQPKIAQLQDNENRAAEVRAEVEAHAALIAKLKAEQEATTALAIAQEAQARASRFLVGDTTTGKSAKESAAVFQAADRKANEDFEAQVKANAEAALAMDAAVKRLRAEIDPLGDIQARLNVELAEADALFKSGRLSATEYSSVLALLRGNADKAAQSIGRTRGTGKSALFGLKPHEVQNLGFQVNDVVTQLASGTSFAQTLGQQGGQILQIFPQVGAAIIRAFSNPITAAFAVTLGTIVLALREANREGVQLRQFQAVLDATADSGVTSAAALSKATDAIDHYGLSAKDATSVVRTFLKEGLNPDRITEFGVAAKDMADILQIDVKDAAKQLADAFTGSYDSVNKLDQATNFLTATQREHIRTLFEEGKAQQARAEAFRIFADKNDETAQKMRGPWSEAARSLGNAYDAFIKLIANTEPIAKAASALGDFGNTVTSVLNALSGATTARDLTFQIDQAYKRIGQLNQSIADSGDIFGEKQRQVDFYSQQIIGMNKALKELQATQKADNSDTRATDTQREAKATQDLARATAELGAKNKTLAAGDRLKAAEVKAAAEADAALQADSFKAASDVQKAEFKRLTIAQARREVEKQISDEIKAQKREDEQTIRSFSAKVPGIESSGNPNAQPRNKDGSLASTAVGLGQFTEDTWLRLFRQHYPEQADKLGKDAILALRRDSETSKKLIELYARENADTLKKAGISITEANLYLAHFLGATGATKLIKAANNTPVANVISADSINANKKVLQGKTVGQVKAFANNKVGDASAAESSVAERLVAIEDARAKLQTRFNEGVKEENDLRQQEITALTAQKGLVGAALIAEQRKEAIADAVLKKQQEIDKLNANKQPFEQAIVFTKEQRDAVAKLAGAYFDLAQAAAKAGAEADDVLRPVRTLTEKRDALRSRIDQLRANGDEVGAGALVPQLDDVNRRLQRAIDQAIVLFQKLDPGTDGLNRTQAEIDGMILSLQNARDASVEWGTVFGVSAKSIADTLASGLTDGVDNFFQRLQQGQKVFKALKDSFLDFAASFLRQIEKMILQQLAFNAAKAILSAVGVPVGTNHTGGIAGRDRTSTRVISPEWFASAMRYHTGGIAGLRPGEVPAILQQGEEVLTASDPRHVANGGQGGGDRFAIYNMIDSGDLVQRGLGSRVGQRSLLNFISENSTGINQALGRP